MNELELRQLFKNLSNCYADTGRFENDGSYTEGEVIQAMTEDRFIEAMKEAKILPIHDVSGVLPLPKDAHSLEVFAIKDCKESPTGKEAYIGYKLKTGCFHFISVPYTGNDR